MLLRKLFVVLVIAVVFPHFASAQNCTINAGVNFTVCSGNPVNLDGSIGGPVSNPNTIQWTILSQPGGATATVANANSLMTAVNGATVPGNYTFRFSATCGDNVPVFDDITVTVNPSPAPRTFSGTTSFPCYNGTPIAVTASPAPGAGETGTWSTAGVNAGSFADPNAASTTFTPVFAAEECNTSGSTPFTLYYTVVNSSGCITRSVRVLNIQKVYPLSATAQPLQVCGTATTLLGSCPGTGTPAWTQISGPNTANIVSPAARNSSATGLVAGSYVFRYTVTGGCNPGSVDVTVTVASGTVPTKANAGPDQYFCTMPSTASLSGNTPAVGETGTWSQLAGGSSTITNPNTPNTTVTGLNNAGADYSYLYTISNGVCFSADTVRLIRIPDLALTAPDVNICGAASGITSTSTIATFGNFGYLQVDTVWVSATYLSGPLASTSFTLFKRIVESGNGQGVAGWGPIALGQTISSKLSGSTLYYLLPSVVPNPAAVTYQLSFTFQTDGTASGTYKFKLSFTTKCGTVEKIVTYTKGNDIIGINGGTDPVVPCGSTSTVLAGNLPDRVGFWRTVQMPAGATDPVNVTNQTLRNPPLNGLIPGTYIVRYSSNFGPGCNNNNVDDVKIVVAANPPATPNAGVDKTTCAGTISLSASPVPADATAVWTVESPAASGVVFSDPSAANVSVSNLQPNTTYVFRYTLTNSCGTAFDEITVTTNSAVSPAKPVITGITDCSLTNVTIPATSLFTITHPSYTAGGGIDSTWQFIVGTGATITARQALSTTQKRLGVNFTQPAIVTAIYTLSNPACPAEAQSDTLVAFARASTSPAFTAGPNQEFCSVSGYPFNTTLSGTDYGAPVAWKQVFSSTGQTAVINSPTAASTNVSFAADGIYQFRYEIQPLAAHCPNPPVTDIVQVTVSQAASVAMAGDDINFCNSTGTTNLAASAVTVGTGRWEVYQVQSGIAPSVATPTNPASAVTFSGPGTTVLRWSTYGSIAECGPSSSDLVTVTYYAPAQAGNDQQLCQSASSNLNALNPSPATGVWTQTGGAAATIADPNSPQTVVSGLTPGTYTFRWSVTAPGGCSTTDDVTITISTISSTANAGPDIASCSGGSNTIQLNASPAPAGFTGSWSLNNKPASAPTGSFSAISNAQSRYNGVTVPGKYVFAWTITNGVCSSTDFVEVTAGTDMCTLPVTLGAFTANINDNNCSVVLNWESLTEENVSKYIVERSADGVQYSSIAEITATGNSTTLQRYRYDDKAISAPVYFYRLKIVDRDGRTAYSGIVRAAFRCYGIFTLQVQPNPVIPGQSFQVNISTPEKVGKGLLELRNMMGQTVQVYPVVLTEGMNRISYPARTLPAGSYTIELKNENKTLSTARLIVQ